MRSRGLLNVSANFEPGIADSLDARLRVNTISDLIHPDTYGILCYVGMIVSVNADTIDNNGIYRLTTLPYTDISNWEKYGGIQSYQRIQSKQIPITETVLIDDSEVNAIDAMWNVTITSSLSQLRMTIAISNNEYSIYSVLGDWKLQCTIYADIVNDKISLFATNNTNDVLTVSALLISSF